MKVVIFGAAGAIGSKALKSCLSRNYDVTAFVRNPSKLPPEFVTHPNLTIIQGDAVDSEAVEAAIEGQDAVIQSAGYGSDFSFPWSDKSGSELSMRIVRTVVDAAVRVQTKRTREGKSPLRVWNVSGLVVMDYPPSSSSPQLCMADLLPFIHPEHKANLQYFKQHGDTLDWSILCPGLIYDGDPRGPLDVSVEAPSKLWSNPWVIPGRLPVIGAALNSVYNFARLGVTFGTLGEYMADNLGPGGDFSKNRVTVFEKKVSQGLIDPKAPLIAIDHIAKSLWSSGGK
ncbi:hypothetical protein DL96DRAFT_1525010 [Flagelloscypha sp. PMI_526]|nr:hypothetical protein DL96DRAFT_1525010 [Flagelloscypha sp. PMI_526]